MLKMLIENCVETCGRQNGRVTTAERTAIGGLSAVSGPFRPWLAQTRRPLACLRLWIGETARRRRLHRDRKRRDVGAIREGASFISTSRQTQRLG